MTLNYLAGLALKPPRHPAPVARWWCLACVLAPLMAQADALELRWISRLNLASLSPNSTVAEARRPIGASTPWTQLLQWSDERSAANRAAEAGVDAAKAQSRQSWAAAWMPRVDASASAYRQAQKYKGVSFDIPNSTVAVSATLPLWHAAERAAAQAQESYVDQARWVARNSRASVAKDLSLAYINAVESAELHRLAQAQQQVLLAQLQLNERRLQGGAGTVLEVLETRSRADQARATLADLQARLVTQRLQIERLAGQSVALPQGFNSVQPSLPLAVPPQVEAQSLLAQRNPQWLESQALITAAQSTLKARKAEAWQPTIDAVATADRKRQAQLFEGVSDRQDTTSHAVGVQLSWPIFTGGLQQGRTQESAALLSQAMARQDELHGQLEASLREAYQALRQAQTTIEVQRAVEASALSILDATQKAFNAGIRSNQDLLNAQQEIHVARQNLVSARSAALVAQVNILALLDLLDATSVAPLTTMFETAALQDFAP